MNNQSILIYSNSREAERTAQNLLEKLSLHAEVAHSSNEVLNFFKLNEAIVLLLCFSDLSEGIGLYNTLYDDNTVVSHSVHRAISVCTETESAAAAKYCLEGRVDNYFLYHPMSDPGRLQFIVEKSFTELKNESEFRNCTSYLTALKEQSAILDSFVEGYFKEARNQIDISIDSFSKLIQLFDREIATSLKILKDPNNNKNQDELISVCQKISTLDSDLLVNRAEELRKSLVRNSREWADEAFQVYCRLSRKIHVPPSLVKSLASRKVLVVDDDELFRDIMVAMLEAEDYIALTAASAKEALNVLSQTVPDVILLDIDMPDMTGIELLKILRNNEKWDEVPVLMLTGLVDEETLSTSIKFGANGFFAKPGNEIEGYETIDSLFHDDGPLQTRHKPPPNKSLLTRQQRETIKPLIIDDDAFTLEIIGSLLDNLDVVEWGTAKSGQEALHMLKASSNRYNVLLLDLNMPEMDGIELLRYLVKLRFEGAIILISGYGSRLLHSVENLGSAHSLNLIGSLGKPITPFKLADMLRKADIKKQLRSDQQDGDWIPSANEIRAAIENDEITLYYQPKFEIESRKLAGVEALARWRHPRRGVVAPAQFITPAEDCGLIIELTYQLLQVAVEQHVAWRKSGYDIDVSINIAVSLLDDLSFPDYLSSLVSRTGMEVDKLTLEIPETGLIKNQTHALDILNRLHLRGFKLSIDDFGTGDSTFVKLKRIPFNQLKIDREFVHDGANDKHAHAIVDASVVLSHKLDLEVVAEGVENLEDWVFSKQSGCEIVQGFFLGHPIPGDELIPWIDINNIKQI